MYEVYTACRRIVEGREAGKIAKLECFADAGLLIAGSEFRSSGFGSLIEETVNRYTDFGSFAEAAV